MADRHSPSRKLFFLFLGKFGNWNYGMGVVGFEPTTSWVKAMRSALLNYTPSESTR